MPIIDGKALAKKLEHEVQERVQRAQIDPCLAILQVGNDTASSLYIKKKCEAATRIGATTVTKQLPSTSSDDTLIELLTTWNNDPAINGILVQLPLQGEHNTNRILTTIQPDKDVDAFHPQTTGIISPVHEAVLRLINETTLRLPGSVVAIIANTTTFADPLAQLLKLAGSITRVVLADDLTKDQLADADVVVIAIGRAQFLHPSLTNERAIIVDIGINKDGDKTVGDADTQSFLHSGHFITPVPGGVGPVTISCVLNNLVTLTQRQGLANAMSADKR